MTPESVAEHREWRKRPERLYDPFRIRVKGRDAAGFRFKLTTVLENIGEGGLYVLLDHEVAGGALLSCFVSFSTSPQGEIAEAPRLCARGRVLRAEPQPDGRCGAAVSFTRHRFVHRANPSRGA